MSNTLFTDAPYIFPDDKYGEALEAIYKEIKRAKKKHGDKPFNSHHEGYAVLLEEVDELWIEVKADRIQDSVEESTHVGAMAARYIAELKTHIPSSIQITNLEGNAKTTSVTNTNNVDSLTECEKSLLDVCKGITTF